MPKIELVVLLGSKAMLHLPETEWIACGQGGSVSPMDAIDAYCVLFAKANPELRIEIGCLNGLGCNCMPQTLALLKRSTGRLQAADGVPILHEEGAICLRLAGKDDLSLAVCEESLAVKMPGLLREAITLSRHQKELGQEPDPFGARVVVASHIWEDGKGGLSHRAPTIAEMLLGEMSDVSRVLFPPDANTAVEALRSVYSAQGQIGCIVVPELPIPFALDSAPAKNLFENGAAIVAGEPRSADVQLVAIGAYQLQESLKAAARLTERKIRTSLVAVIEPGRLREPRDKLEAEVTVSAHIIADLFPAGQPRVVVTHTRPEVMTGVLRRIDSGSARMRVLGYKNLSGTPGVGGMLFANGCTWAHIVFAAAQVLDTDPARFLETREILAVMERGIPAM